MVRSASAGLWHGVSNGDILNFRVSVVLGCIEVALGKCRVVPMRGAKAS